MFQKDRFIEDCKKSVAEGQKAIRELVLEAVADPAGIVAELGEPTKAGADFIGPGQAVTLGRDIIHSVAEPWDMEHTRAVFRQAETRFNAGLAAGA